MRPLWPVGKVSQRRALRVRRPATFSYRSVRRRRRRGRLRAFTNVRAAKNGPGGDHTEAVRIGFSPRKLFWEMPHGSGVRGILLRAALNVQSRWRELVARHSPVGFLHPIEGLMLSVLDLDPVLQPYMPWL